MLLFFADSFFDWPNELVDQRYTEEGLLVVCVVIFSQLKLPNCLRTGLLLVFGLVLQQFHHSLLEQLISIQTGMKLSEKFN